MHYITMAEETRNDPANGKMNKRTVFFMPTEITFRKLKHQEIVLKLGANEPMKTKYVMTMFTSMRSLPYPRQLKNVLIPLV